VSTTNSSAATAETTRVITRRIEPAAEKTGQICFDGDDSLALPDALALYVRVFDYRPGRGTAPAVPRSHLAR
jgi:hypothetical protein